MISIAQSILRSLEGKGGPRKGWADHGSDLIAAPRPAAP